MLRRTLRAIGIMVGCLVLYLAILGWMVYSGSLTLPAHHGLDRHENGVWMAHPWFDDRRATPLSQAEIETACERFNACGIRYLYIHVGPLDSRGNLPPWESARWARVRDQLRLHLPGCSLLAWVGGLNGEFEGTASDALFLRNLETRESIVKGVVRLHQEGFDGIHYDIEPVADHDASFLALLTETEAVLGQPKPALLSVATPWARPQAVPSLPVLRPFWSTVYYRMVSQKCDQLVLMAYDGAQPSASMYTRFVRYEVRHITNAIDCPLLVGVPTYKEKTFSHNPRVENLESALPGVILGGKEARGLSGVAVYAGWTTSPEEWTILRRVWCEKREP